MNKIEKLIIKYCPKGVVFDSIENLLIKNNILIINPSKKINKRDYKKMGKYPIVDQGKNYISAYTDSNNGIINCSECVVFGDHTEITKYIDFPFAQGADGIKILKTNSNINVKYLYYVINQFYKKKGKYTRHFSFLKKIIIPIPPLLIQKNIVKILDKFNSLIEDISVGLPAEINARRKQYKHYQEKLLLFKEKNKRTNYE